MKKHWIAAALLTASLILPGCSARHTQNPILSSLPSAEVLAGVAYDDDQVMNALQAAGMKVKVKHPARTNDLFQATQTSFVAWRGPLDFWGTQLEVFTYDGPPTVQVTDTGGVVNGNAMAMIDWVTAPVVYRGPNLIVLVMDRQPADAEAMVKLLEDKLSTPKFTPIDEDFTLAGVRLGDTMETVERLLGKPDQVVNSDQWRYTRLGVELLFGDQQVTKITALENYQGQTHRGIGIDNTRDKVSEVYGTLSAARLVGPGDRYQRIRFTFDQADRVKYVDIEWMTPSAWK